MATTPPKRTESAPVQEPTPPPPTAKEIQAASDALRVVCERLPDGEDRAAALAHIRTALRWATRALG